MINSKKKRFLSAFMILAVAATATLGGLSAVSNSAMRSPVANADTTIVNKTPESEATIYYVGTPADGATGTGTSPDDPMSVVDFNNKVNNISIKGGDIVKIMPGTHKVNFTITLNANGSYDDYIIFEPYDNTQDTVLDFSEMRFDSTNRGVQINGNYYYWYGIDVCGAGDNGLYIGGSYNVVENCEFYNNRDTGLQLGRSYSEYTNISQWPSYNLIKNCTSYNNYDNETYGENADGFAAKLTVGYGNIFDGCIAYRNSDDGWDLYGKVESGKIGSVILYNCVAFENGFLMDTQANCNAVYGDSYDSSYNEGNTNSYTTRDGDGNGFKLGGSTMPGDVVLYNCYAFNNRMHGVTDNSNPGVLSIDGVISYNNGADIDSRSNLNIIDENGNTSDVYYTIGSDGYILRSESATQKAIIRSDTKTTSADYASLDENGYILKSDGTQVTEKHADNKDVPISGQYVKAATTGQTVNPEFGYITYTTKTGSDSLNNIDVARDENSYNALKNVLSVANGNNSLGSDAYKGSVEYSIFVTLSGNNYGAAKIEENIDASSYEADKSAQPISNFAAASDIFVDLPTSNFGLSSDIHENYRNTDGSINMRDILKIKDYTVLLGEEHKIGADLSKSSWSEYTHFNYTYLTDDSITSEDEAKAIAVQSILFVPCNTDACYQDFELITKLADCTISWQSSDSNLIAISENETVDTINGYSTREAIVCRAKDGDKTVTLTATITAPDGATKVKTFNINVKKNVLAVGEIIVDGVEDDKLIIDQFSLTSEPSITVTNASDYNGKLLDAGDYTVATKYLYSSEKGGFQVEVSGFTPSVAGVYEITKTVTIGESSSESYTYIVYVVSGSANVDFTETPVVNVNRDGFTISGTLNNVSGTLYTMVSDTQPTAERLKAQGEVNTITNDSIMFSFDADNGSSYTVYYMVCNPNGEVTSEIYSTDIDVVDITTEEEFNELLCNGGESNKIYLLQNDLDFEGKTWQLSSEAFVGLLNGNNHTVKNISLENTGSKQTGMFYSLKGGTIMNITFQDISIEGAGQKVGIIGEAYYGYISNVKLNEVSVVGASQRVGALIGQALEGPTPLYIDRVSLVNKKDTSIINGNGGSSTRAGGLIGLIQPTSEPTTDLEIYISNCYVDATIGSDKCGQIGGIVGTYDTQKSNTMNLSLSIDHCYFVGTVISSNRGGGILGYQQGNGTLRISYCVSDGTLYHAGGTTPVVTAEKNCSGIVGGYVSTADAIISRCYARFEEHNADYDVSVIDDSLYNLEAFWANVLGFDIENIWQYNTEAPYVTLR